MGKLVNAFAGIVAVLFVVIIIGAFVWAFWPKPELEQSTTSDMHTYDEVVDLVKNYRGKDNSGQKLSEIIAMSILVAYPDEEILKNPSTDYGFSALPMDGDPDIDRRWDAKFYLKTYRESVSYEWAVDMDTKEIYAKNENGKDVLDVLDAYE